MSWEFGAVAGTKGGKLMKWLMIKHGASMKEGDKMDGWDGCGTNNAGYIMKRKNGVSGVISSGFLSSGFDFYPATSRMG